MNKNKMTIKQQIEMMERYCVYGVPMTSLKEMCRACHISYPKLMKELFGSTIGLVGGVGIVYPVDIKRFITKSPIWD